MRTLILAFAVFLGTTFVATAQTKVAHIDVQKVLEQLPAMKSAEAQLKKLEQTYMADIQASVKELQTKAQAVQSEASSLTEEQIRAREAEFQKKYQELQAMDANIKQAQQTAAQDLQKKQQELVEPIMKKVKDAIEKVAKAQGIQYVFNSSAGSGLIVANGTDLFPAVKKELGF